jgi:hypothetical protein
MTTFLRIAVNILYFYLFEMADCFFEKSLAKKGNDGCVMESYSIILCLRGNFCGRKIDFIIKLCEV